MSSDGQGPRDASRHTSSPTTTPAPRNNLARHPADNQVLVRVHTCTANPVDNAIAAGMLSGMSDRGLPVILGRDYAGVVEQLGEVHPI